MIFPRLTTERDGRRFHELSRRPIFSNGLACLLLAACAILLALIDG